MALPPQVEVSVRRLANRIGISDDSAIVLLVKYHWDEDDIVEKWNNDPSSRLGIVTRASEIFSGETVCDFCDHTSICKTYGCRHRLCLGCVKDYIEEKVSVGSLNIKCRVDQCDKMMFCKRFLEDISPAV